MENSIKKRMKIAINLAQKSLKFNDVPIGCVIFDSNNKCIGKGYNSCIKNNDPSAHAEVLAIKNACKKKKTLVLENSSLYVTLEPCQMCETLIKATRIKNIFFGAYNIKYRKDRILHPNKNFFFSESKYCFNGGFEEELCAKILKDFFIRLREIT